GGATGTLPCGSQPPGGAIMGRKEPGGAATRETFPDYTGRWYRPERMVVGIAGRLDGDVRADVERLLGDLEPAKTGAPAAVEPPSNGSGPQIRLHTKHSDQAHLIVGVPSRPLDDPDRYVLQILATVLGGGMSSRLFTEVRERRGLAYYVYSVNHSYTDAGSFHAQAGGDINRIDEAVDTTVGELRRTGEERVPADELAKAKSFAKGRFVLQLENPQGLILFGLRREVLEGGAVEPDDVLAAIDAVTGEDVQRVAQDVLGSNALRLALIGPFEDAEHFEQLLAGS